MSPSLIDTPALPFLERYLDLSTFRQTLVASNLANIDTPGYQTRDVALQSELGYSALSDFKDDVHPFVRTVRGLIERPDGNNVSLDREGLLLAQTQLQYKTAIELIRSEFRTIHGAINDGVEA